MIYNLGIKALRRLVIDGDGLAFHHAKLNDSLFKGDEKGVFEAVRSHLAQFNKLPKQETLEEWFPSLKDEQAPEPLSYYLSLLQNRFEYDVINQANLKSQEILKGDKTKVTESAGVLQQALRRIAEQRYRHRILDFGKEGEQLLLHAYGQGLANTQAYGGFGWPYLDQMTGGVLPGDVASFVGRPAMGKTWLSLYTAVHNWRKRHRNVLFVSMEMNILAISQRLGSMYSHTPVSQLKNSAFSSATFKVFQKSLSGLKNEVAKLYVVNGNLAAEVEDIYVLAAQLECADIVFDGAYMLKHPNKRLDRFARVAENVEMMKQRSEDQGVSTYASWQLNRVAAKKEKKKGEKAGLEDIGYTDAVGQISSIVLGLMQEEGIETMNRRAIDVMKGRSGEIGRFEVNWDFQAMNFDQVIEEQVKPLEFV